MNEIDLALGEALVEYERTGALSTTTFMSLTNLGVDAQAYLNDLEG